MGLGCVAALNRLQEILHLALADTLLGVVVLLDGDVSAQREHTAYRRLDLVDTALLILQKRTASLIPHRLEPNNRHTGIIANVSLTVLGKELSGCQLQFFGNPKNIHRTQKNILTVKAAKSTLGTVELKCVIQTNGHLINVSS